MWFQHNSQVEIGQHLLELRCLRFLKNLFYTNGIFSPIYHLLKRLKKYIAREWELKQCLKTIKLVVTILVSAKANEIRLNNLILLIAISYTISSFQV